MKKELEKTYDPKEVEERWYKTWEGSGYFKADPQSERPPFSMVIPPPNVTGSLHIGHALNNSLQDLLARYMRMKGHDVLWVPGCDHAGIATQNVVEREIAKEGKKRDDLGREKFLERVWDWKKQSGDTIMRQLRRLGASCDWDYERFTMDEGLSKAVQEAFIRLYDDGFIYQGDYIINWCPRCGTALSDIEAEYQETDGKLYHVRYPVIKGGKREWVVVATTRPETIMGDTAVCVNPKDERFADLEEGAVLRVPVVDREVPLIRDSYVETEFGTGALKVTPAHDANDFALGDKYGLKRIKIMDPKGVMNEEAGPYQGMDRFECRKKIVEDLKAQGLLEKVEDYHHSVSHCYRCHTVVESYLSKQWFVKMKPLAQEALKAVEDGKTEFLPANYTKTYTDWLENIRDWCISRQIWWGHRIPVYYAKDGRQAAGRNAAEAAKKLGVAEGELSQDPDVLDTWFSSGLWPFSTLGWPEKTKELERYYPTSILVTSWDILFFWVARMSMFGLHVEGEVPFRQVLINSLVADEHGKKMSKSKGNVIDPLTKIDTIGADALRYALFSIESQSRYISLSEERLQSGRNFMNKIWNAARFMLMNLEGLDENKAPELPAWDSLNLWQRWIVARFNRCLAEIDSAYEKGYQVNWISRVLYDFIWHDLCDQFIESSKIDFQSDNPAQKQTAQQVLAVVLERTLRLLHPLCPFITEEVWQKLPGAGDTIMKTPWPQALAESGDTASLVEDFTKLQEALVSMREYRAEYEVDKSRVIELHVRAQGGTASLLEEARPLFSKLALAEVADIKADLETPKNAPVVILKDSQIYLVGVVDVAKEQERLKKKLEEYRRVIESTEKKLSNEAFVSKAPDAVVEKERLKKKEFEAKLSETQKNLEEIGV